MTKTSKTYTIKDQKKEITNFLDSADISLEKFIQVMDYLSHYTSADDWAFLEETCLLMEEETSKKL
jgi:hypothetical protein